MGSLSHRTGLCPLCQSSKARHLDIGLHHCANCGIAFNASYSPIQYNDSYFLEEYKSQYGRTYAEDCENICKLADRRLSAILGMIPAGLRPADISLLDIGSALGFFLKRARVRGIGRVSGIEISEYAYSYARDNLGIDMFHGSFDEADLDRHYHIITAWFFIEHCADPIQAIEKISAHLKGGGILAFSAPSIWGPLFYRRRNEWIKNHPPDHRIDLSPRGARRLLKGLGFDRIIIRPAGFHPERMVKSDSIFFKFFRPLYRLFSCVTAFSDTIEVYARKAKNPVVR